MDARRRAARVVADVQRSRAKAAMNKKRGYFFAVLGVQPILGAGFPAAPFYSRENVAIISHRLWRR